MKVTFLGHAGLFVETSRGSILCDPWFNPAYIASWVPFPSNRELDLGRFSRPDYLYISHLHQDHFDAAFLTEHVSRDTTVILPDYPLDLMERRYRSLGFENFFQTRNGEIHDLPSGLQIAVLASVAPTDGPLGDSGLVVDDGETRIYDQNDSRPVDIDRLQELGPYDAHFVQFSGAIWYPFVYRFPPAMMQALSRKKRENEMSRALRYVTETGARFVFPSAGPPCFLDDELFEFNDFDRDETNIFPDQTVFLDFMRDQGHENGRLLLPGSVANLNGSCTVEHALPQPQIDRIFGDKRAYLLGMKSARQPEIDAVKASLPRGQVDVLNGLKEWFEPLLEKADVTCAGINGVLVLDLGDEEIAIDFHRRVVEPWTGGDDWDYRFHFDRPLIEHCIVDHVEDWVNDLFLSCRFEAERKGAFNEYVYNFFKCLSMERLQYAEGYYAERAPIDQFWEAEGFRIQRRCPHLKADLTKFAEIENGVLTCTLHGWQFELATGKCLTSDDRRLYSKPVSDEPADPAEIPVATSGASIRSDCGHCRYDAAKFRRRASSTDPSSRAAG